MKPLLIRNILLPLHQKITGSNFSKWLSEARQNQWLSKKELRELQIVKLKKLIEHAYKNVPYYKNLFSEHSLKPKDINSLDDLQKIPILTKKDLQGNLKSFKAKNYTEKDLFEKGTGGSTGTPTKFYVDKIYYDYRRAGQYRFYDWTGYEIGDKHILFWGAQTDISEVAKLQSRVWNYFLNKFWINAFVMTEETMLKADSKINKLRPKLITGYANSLYVFSKFLEENNIFIYSPKAIVSTAEVLLDQQRELIRKTFKCHVFNRYGCREMCDIAQNCSQSGNLLHVNADNIILEAVKKDEATENGQVGEIVLTDLNNYAMPFIRFKNDDIGNIFDEECPCGRSFPLIEISAARKFDIITTPEGKYVHGVFFYYLFYDLDGIFEYQIVQEDINRLLIKIVRGNNYSDDTTKWLNEKIQESCGKQMKIQFLFLENIPKGDSGKFRFVKSVIPLTS